ncbi:filamentous hemagglutinin N-terminal domain-containing protein [Desmonostoc muscorum LEGE 12446]|nr:filamentous hemagglutinin N-terminal domain-containing protein [Desmonostoc muscorum]MCF2150242.1 filamentous hemagglutinin N-terminal domain-containing protein [Desmonostoc muscorum LEGE 12446]
MSPSKSLNPQRLSFLMAIATFIPASIAIAIDPSFAQIIPDATLGTQITANDNIVGGTTRGASLFHSFQEFNVNSSQRVYFANPSGINNIFSRVTGNNVSNILGTLGVNGVANLYLLNPNGIIFGPNTKLDIRGSFLATTANRLVFPDGGEFGVNNLQALPLLSVSVPLGVQYGNATISSTGNLAAGQDLTLSAGNLDLQGQLQAGKDLTLQAENTVRVRDSVTTPFVALSGGNLTIQGNKGIDILALNHPTQTPFVSGGNLSLISDGIISGDAKFATGGSFLIKSVSGELANFVSKYDPIISANGDVDFAASYTGTSLLVEARGNIRFQGDININGPDTGVLPDGPDTQTLRTSSALILRSGQSTLNYEGVNYGNVPDYSTGSVPLGITLNGDVTLQPFNGSGGIVYLSAASGDINTKLISTDGGIRFTQPLVYDGGSINISTSNGDITTGSLDSSSSSFSNIAGNGGKISLNAINGNITTDILDSTSSSLRNAAGNGGEISLNVTNGNITTFNLNSFSSGSGNAGNGGKISLNATNGNITIRRDLNSSSISNNGLAGNGGEIILTAINGGITMTGPVASFSFSGNLREESKKGGNIYLQAKDSIEIFSLNSTGGLGSGNITIISQTSFTLDDRDCITSDTFGYGNGGDILIDAPSIILNNGAQISSSTHNSGKGGDITLRALDRVEISGQTSDTPRGIFSQSYSITAIRGNQYLGGYIPTGEARIPDSSEKLLFPSGLFTQTTKQSTGSTGTIRIETGKLIIEDEGAIAATRWGQNNNGSENGNISVDATDSILVTNKGRILSGVAEEASGNSGNIELTAGSLSVNNGGYVQTLTLGDGNAGDIQVSANVGVTVSGNSSYLRSSSGNNTLKEGNIGQGGDIVITTPNLGVTDGAVLDARTLTNSKGGNIGIQASNINLTGGSSLSVETQGAAQGGNLTIQQYNNGQDLTINFQDDSRVSASTAGSGDGGFVTVTAPKSITITGNGKIAAETTSSGKGGDIKIESTNGQINIQNGAQITANSNSEQEVADAGNIEVTAKKVRLDNGEISTKTTSGNGGDIGLNIQDFLLLRHGSLISATAGTSNRPGNGGNIRINNPGDRGGFVIAVPWENSDIIANAYADSGGRIEIFTNRNWGFQQRQGLTENQLRNNTTSDISASSQLGRQGEIVTDTLDVDPTQGIVELPVDLVDPTQQITQGCRPLTANASKQQSEFVITGRGGLPPSPDDPVSSGTVPIPWVARDIANATNVTSSVELPTSTPTTTLVEAQGMIHGANGEVILIAQAATATPHQSGFSNKFCHQ